MSYYTEDEMWVEKVPLFLLAKTDTLLPINFLSFSFSASIMTPDP